MERAQRGRFSQADMRHVPPPVRARYFKPDGDGWLASDALRKHLRFRVEDLLHARYPTGLDLVLCRNVVIYFNDAARNHVHRGIAGALRTGGYFMVGATERVGDPAGHGPRDRIPLHLSKGRLMEFSDYLPMFLAEARENLQSLNLALVEVEQNPTDAETINQIFRIAHSLKGMSATMGFARMAALTHEMENVMEGMKTRADGLGRDALDTLFACLDALERMTDEIEADGQEATDPGRRS